MLDILFSGFWVQLVIHQYLQPIFYLKYFTELVFGLFGN